MPRSLLSSSNLLHVYPLILQECKCARTNPREREGFFPSYPVFPPDSPLPLPFLPHFSALAPLIPFPLSLLDFCFSRSEILYRKPELYSANYDRCVFKALYSRCGMYFFNSGNDSQELLQVSLVLCEVKI